MVSLIFLGCGIPELVLLTRPLYYIDLPEDFGVRGYFSVWLSTCYQWQVGTNSMKNGFKNVFHFLCFQLTKLIQRLKDVCDEDFPGQED